MGRRQRGAEIGLDTPLCTKGTNQQTAIYNHDRLWITIYHLHIRRRTKYTKNRCDICQTTAKERGKRRYDGKPLNLIGFINVDVQVGKRTIKKAQIVIARDRKRSLVRRDWLTQLTYRVAEASKESKCAKFVNKIESKIELSPELKSIQQKFPKIFSRQGKITRHTIKNESKEGVRITQQKRRRVPLQPQTAVDAEVRRLLAAGHIKRIDKITDDMFIQPVVIRVKNDTCQNSAKCQVAQ